MKRPLELAERKPKELPERLPLGEILGQLLQVNPDHESDVHLQLEAATALAEWSPSHNGGKEVLTEELKRWGSRGPDFDGIIADILNGKYNHSLEVRRALMTNLAEMSRRGDRQSGFEPGFQDASRIQQAIAMSLFDNDPVIRQEAEVLAKRKRLPTITPPPDGPSFELVIAQALEDPKRRGRALSLLETVTPRGKGFRVPPWLRESEEVQQGLIDLLRDPDREVRHQTAHQLIHRMGSATRTLTKQEEEQKGEEEQASARIA